MRPLVPILLAGTLSTAPVCSGPGAGSVQPDGADPATPVLVELFTSEACSSCPPADQLLRTLVSTQPIRGVEVVALGEHVDYWNGLGWPDRFSSPAFTQRQSEYQASVFPSSTVYTPQLIVDGALQRIGSDGQAVRQAIAMILLEFTHVCTPSQRDMLRTIVGGPATTRSERVIARALLHVVHTASPGDRPRLEALMKSESTPAPVRILASVIRHLTHTPTDADREILTRLASAD